MHRGIEQRRLKRVNFPVYLLFLLCFFLLFLVPAPASAETSFQTVWTRQPGTSTSDYSNAMAKDYTGNIYVAGETYGTFDANTNIGYLDVVILKVAPDGTKLWSRQIGSSAYDHAQGVAVDSAGYVYVTGYTYLTFDNNVNMGALDIFIVKYSPDGTKLWSRQIGSSGTDYAYGISLDAAGNA